MNQSRKETVALQGETAAAYASCATRGWGVWVAIHVENGDGLEVKKRARQDIRGGGSAGPGGKGGRTEAP